MIGDHMDRTFWSTAHTFLTVLFAHTSLFFAAVFIPYYHSPCLFLRDFSLPFGGKLLSNIYLYID